MSLGQLLSSKCRFHYPANVPCHLADAPIVTCHRHSAFTGEEKIHVECEVRSNPRVTSLRWDINGTALGDNGVGQDMWLVNQVRQAQGNYPLVYCFMAKFAIDIYGGFILVN